MNYFNNKSLNLKILIVIVPIVIVSISIYFIYEILEAKSQFQNEFDKSISNSVLILKPSLSANIYNLEKQNVVNSVKGLFINENISKAIIFGEKKTLFVGIEIKNNKDFNEITSNLNISDYTNISDLKLIQGVISLTNKNNKRIYISAIVDKETSRFDGVIVIEAELTQLNKQINKMIYTAIFGLFLCVCSIVILSFSIINKIVSKPLQILSTQIGQQSDDIYSTNKKLSGSFIKVSGLSKSQSDSIVQIQSQMDQMVEIIAQTKNNADECIRIVDHLNNKTKEGSRIIETMTLSVGKIGKSSENLQNISKMIGDISAKAKVINNIVSKTELLSLNASIESARAGALGKGFSVVAEEVGNLAKMSGKAANEIDTLISESQKVAEIVILEMNNSVGEIKNNSVNVSNSFKDIASEVTNILSNTKEIQDSTNKQNSSIVEVVSSVNTAGEINNQTFDEMKSLIIFAKEIDLQCDKLKNIMELMNNIILGQKDKIK